MTDPTRRRRDLLHLAALASIAFVQPLFDRIAGSPEFLLLHRAGWLEVALIVLVFSMGLPLTFCVVRLAASMLGPRSGRAAQLLLVWVCVTTIAMAALEGTGLSWQRQILAAPGVGLVGTIAYARLETIRLFVSFLAPAVLIVPAIFVFRVADTVTTTDRDEALLIGSASVPAPVIMVVFDEFSLTSLLDPLGGINAARFPNFARLARRSTWYRNATTVASVTQAALPALLTGRYPGPDPLIDRSSRVGNLFSLVAGSHTMDVEESYVPLCPPWICVDESAVTPSRGRLLRDLATVTVWPAVPAVFRLVLPRIAFDMMLVQPGEANARLGQMLGLMGARALHEETVLGRRREVFEDFVERLVPGDQPSLHYLHILLPHEPSVYEPSGALCAAGHVREPLRWGRGLSVVATAYQRHLQQVEFVDGLIGRLVAHLESTGLWDESLLIVTADHGVSHRPGDERRALTRTNYCDVLAVPLFVKRPGQHSGGASDRNVEIVDVLPTLADVLGIPVPWPVDGRSLLRPADPPRLTRHVSGPSWPEERSLFESASDSAVGATLPRACLGLNRERAWRAKMVGGAARLVGRALGEVPAAAMPAAVGASLDHPEGFEAVPADRRVLPCPISGRLTGLPPSSPPPILAVALNGRVAAVVRAFGKKGAAASFQAVVPAADFRPGANDVEVFLVEAVGKSWRLRRLRR
jgi:Sulfatase